MVLLPWVTTSASETPSAFTRFSMIVRACSIDSLLGVPPAWLAM